MVWFFDRDGERLRYEIRHGSADATYELLLTYPDGRTESETLHDPVSLLRRCAELVQALKQQGWVEA